MVTPVTWETTTHTVMPEVNETFTRMTTSFPSCVNLFAHPFVTKVEHVPPPDQHRVAETPRTAQTHEPPRPPPPRAARKGTPSDVTANRTRPQPIATVNRTRVRTTATRGEARPMSSTDPPDHFSTDGEASEAFHKATRDLMTAMDAEEAQDDGAQHAEAEERSVTCLENLLAISEKLPRNGDTTPSQDAGSIRDIGAEPEAHYNRVKRHLCAGFPGKAKQAMLAQEPFDISTTIGEQRLRATYPQRTEAVHRPIGDEHRQPLQVTASEVCKFIKSRSPTTAGGKSGMAYALFQRLLKKATPEMVQTLTDFIQRIINGKLTVGVATRLNELRGVAFKKPDSDKPRPIGIGEAFLQVASGLAASKLSEKVAGILGPTCVGVGIPDGPSVAAQSVRLALEKNPSWGVLKLDVTNAFNSVDRQAVLDVVAEKLPEIFEYAWSRYALPSTVEYRPREGHPIVIPCTQGVVQGDPLSGLLYNLAQEGAYKPVEAWAAENKLDLATVKVHDDGHLLGPPDVIFGALKRLRDHLGKMTLHLNFSKCVAFSFSEGTRTEMARLAVETGDTEDARVKVRSDGIKVGGIPVGTATYISEMLEGEAARLINTIVKFEDLTAPSDADGFLQGKFQVFRLCGPAAFVHLIRGLPPEHTHMAAVGVDEALQRAVYNTFGIFEHRDSSCGRETVELINTPIRLGGFGLMSLKGAAKAAHLASFTLGAKHVMNSVPQLTGLFTDSTGQHLAYLRTIIDDLKEKAPKVMQDVTIASLIAEPKKKLQAAVHNEVSGKAMDLLIAGATGVRKSRLLNGAMREAGAWLHVLPRVKMLRLTNAEFQTAARIRAGGRLTHREEQTCSLCDRAPLDFDHMNRCTSTDAKRIRNERHTHIKSAVLQELRAYTAEGFTSENEPYADRYLTPLTGRGPAFAHKRGDVGVHVSSGSLSNTLREQRFLVDVVVTYSADRDDHHGRGSHNNSASTAEREKLRDEYAKGYTEDSLRLSFVPFGVETYGAFGDSAHRWMAKVRSILGGSDSPLAQRAMQFLRHRVSLSLQRVHHSMCVACTRTPWLLAQREGVVVPS